MDLKTQGGAPARTEEEKKRELYLRQKHMLEGFLRRGAVSRAQYEKSLGDLTAKMGMETLREADDLEEARGHGPET